MEGTLEYSLIKAHYGNRVAERSQVPLMNHINEGLIILDAIGATSRAKKAFCLHPLLQADEDLKQHYVNVSSVCNAQVVLLAMEYRNTANAYLSDKITTEQPLKLSPLYEVNDMLIADKVQNMKDFITYHYKKHKRSDELMGYFNKWLDALDVSTETYHSLCKQISKNTQ